MIDDKQFYNTFIDTGIDNIVGAWLSTCEMSLVHYVSKAEFLLLFYYYLLSDWYYENE